VADELEDLERAIARKKRRLRVFAAGLGLVTVAGAAVLAAFALHKTPEQKFRRSALGTALADPLSDYVADLGMNAPASGDAKKALFSDGVEKQMGPDAFGALRVALGAIPQAQRSEDDVDTAMRPLFEALNVVDARLAERHVPAFLDAYARGESGERAVWITSYYARERAETTVEGRRLRLVWGVRLDGLNLVDLRMWKADAAEWMLLSYDVVQEDFVETLLRSITRHAPLGRKTPLGDDDHSPPAELAREASALLSAEVLAGSRLSPQDASAVDDLLTRRNVAAGELRQNGYAIDKTDRLALPRWKRRVLENSRGRAPQIDEMLRNDDALAAYEDAFYSAVDRLAALDEQEFVVRLLEADRLKDSPVAALDAQNADYPEMRGIASAELAMLARPQPCPRLALWRAARWAYDEQYNGVAHRAGIAVLDALFRELGLPGSDAWVGESPLDEHFAAALRAALARPPADVQAAAGRAYAGLFGRPPPVYARTALP
jgi:hypothetical protein